MPTTWILIRCHLQMSTKKGPPSDLGSPNNGVHGWVGQSGDRGTIDITWTSLATMFISTYVMLCLNVPSIGEPWWSITRRRILYIGILITGPELVLTAAAGQWAAAMRSVEDFHSADFESWILRHAFFADMGGIGVDPPHCVPFRVNAKQLHYLITKHYLRYLIILLNELSDQSKQDSVAKIINSLQITYLILQCIRRACQHLAITTLELFALAIVVCSIATSWCWLRKPADVNYPIRIHIDK